jgi:hypothetical protein
MRENTHREDRDKAVLGIISNKRNNFQSVDIGQVNFKQNNIRGVFLNFVNSARPSMGNLGLEPRDFLTLG